jgi:hypothetical protein
MPEYFNPNFRSLDLVKVSDLSLTETRQNNTNIHRNNIFSGLIAMKQFTWEHVKNYPSPLGLTLS